MTLAQVRKKVQWTYGKDYVSLPYMAYKYERFDLRMDQQEREALEKLAEYEGITMSKWVKKAIRRSAKRKRVWE